jgi:hypothetical protein
MLSNKLVRKKMREDCAGATLLAVGAKGSSWIPSPAFQARKKMREDCAGVQQAGGVAPKVRPGHPSP